MVVLCCAIKPLCSWNVEDTATTCRERCGGQGYLSVNRFGSLIGFAHAGMTAEGDNRCASMCACVCVRELVWGGLWNQNCKCLAPSLELRAWQLREVLGVHPCLCVFVFMCVSAS